MDDILNAVVDEVALEGQNGCTMDRLWTLLDARKGEFVGTLDEFGIDLDNTVEKATYNFLDEEYQDYLWPFIVPVEHLRFTIRASRSSSSAAKTDAKGKGKAKGKRKRKQDSDDDEDEEEEEGEAHQEGGGEPPRPSGAVSREDLSGLTRREVLDKYGQSFRIIASEEQQRHAILGRNDPTFRLSPAQYSALSTIAKYRSNGISQAELAKKLGMDPRSLFHLVKVVMESNLVIKVPVVAKGTSTNLCIHTRFASDNEAFQEYQSRCSQLVGEEPTEVALGDATTFRYKEHNEDGMAVGADSGVSYHSDLVKQGVTQLLRQARDNLMVVQDLMDELKINTRNGDNFERKWFNRLIDAMVKSDYIERVNVPKRRDGFEVRGFERCVKLKKKYVAATNVTGNVAGTPRIAPHKGGLYASRKLLDADKDKSFILGEGGILAELPLEWQIYRLIVYAGDKGVTGATIQRSLNNIGPRMLTKFLARLTKPDHAPPEVLGAHRIGEFVGRERRYRYYDKDAYNRILKSQAESLDLDLQTPLAVGSAAEPEEVNEDAELAEEVRELQDGSETPDGAAPVEEMDVSPVSVLKTPSKSAASASRPQRKKKKVHYADLEAGDDLVEVAPVTESVEPVPEPISVPSPDPIANTICKKCKKDENEDLILLCDHCNAGLHMYCAKPALAEIPEGDWFCSKRCQKKGKVERPSSPPPTAPVEPPVQERPPPRIVPDGDNSEDEEFVPDHESDVDDAGHEEDNGDGETPRSAKGKRTPKARASPVRALTPVVLPTPPSAAKKVSLHGNALIPSITEAYRRQVLNRLLEEQKILEVGFLLIQSYQDIVKAHLQGPLTAAHTIDKKTLLRTGKKMEDAGEVRMLKVNVPQISGGVNIRTLFLHPSLSPEDPKVQGYIDMMADRNFLMGGKNKPFKVEVRADLEVERLADKKRKEKERARQRDGESPGWDELESPAPEANDDEPKPSAYETAPRPSPRSLPPTTPQPVMRRKKVPRQDPNSEAFWLQIAQTYGYISAKMQRAKLFHEWLLMKLLRTEQDMQLTPASQGTGPFRNGGVIQTSSIFRELPFELYLKTIGLTLAAPAVDEFMSNPKYPTTKIQDLPEEVRKVVFGPKPKFRRGLRQMFDILGALQVVTPVAEQDSEQGPSSEVGDSRARERILGNESLAWSYRLNWRIPLRDYAREDPPLIRYFNIVTHDIWREFWFQLEFVCARQDLEGWEAIDVDATVQNDDLQVLSERVRGLGGRADPLGNITLVRNWRAAFQMTPEQRTTLDSYVNRATGETPLENDSMCRKLADQLGLNVQRVKNYYRRFDEEYQRKLATTPRKPRGKRKKRFETGDNDPNKRPRSLRGWRMGRWQYGQVPLKHEGGMGGPYHPSAYPANELAGQLQYFYAQHGGSSASTPQEQADALERMRAAGQRVKRAMLIRRQGRPSYRKSLRDANVISRQVAAAASGHEEHNMEQIPVIGDQDRFQDQYQAAAKRVRSYWSPEEDDILIHAYAIIRNSFPKGTTFMWLPVGKLFKQRDAKRPGEIARRRFVVLWKSVAMQDRIKVLETHWPSVKAAGIAEGKIHIPITAGPVDWDLRPMIEYFRHYMANMLSSAPETVGPFIPLPGTLEDIHKNFNIVVAAQKTAIWQPTDLPDLLESNSKTSLVQHMAVLYARPLTANIWDSELLDFRYGENDKQSRELHLLKTLIKMIYMTPAESYNPTLAFSVLQSHPSDLIIQALQALRDEQSIVKMKNLSDRGLPGRGFQLSDKFLATLAGTLPQRLLPQAVMFRRQLLNDLREGGHVFSPLISGGGMFTLLDSLSAGEITATPCLIGAGDESKDEEDETNVYTDIIVQPSEVLREKLLQDAQREKGKRPIDTGSETETAKRSRTVAGDGSRRAAPAEALTDVENASTKAEMASPDEPIDIQTAEDVLENAAMDPEEKAWVRKIYEMVTGAGADGMTEHDLKHALQPFQITGNTFNHYITILKTKLRVQPDNIPLVTVCGFTDIHYVSYVFLDQWTLPVVSPIPEDMGPNPIAPKVTKKAYRTPPRLWYDMNGKKIDSVLRGCMEAVLGSVMQKPGIYESKLQRRFASVMTRVELHEVLQMLVGKGAARRRTLVKPAMPSNPLLSLFGAEGNDGFRDAGPEEIDEEITCYWAQPNWFMHTMGL